MLTHLDLFAGIGGFSLAAKYLPVLTTTHVEINEYCHKVIVKNFPDSEYHYDIATYDGSLHSHDLITAGSPCQDFSIMGLRKGLFGDKSVLITEVWRLISQIRPRGFILENVPGIIKFLPELLPQVLQIGGYELRWFCLSVEQLGGVHIRNRVFILGKATDSYLYNGFSSGGNQVQERADSTSGLCPVPDGSARQTKPHFCSSDDGIPGELAGYLLDPRTLSTNYSSGMDTMDLPSRGKELSALGNAVTPQQAYWAFRVLLQWLEAD